MCQYGTPMRHQPLWLNSIYLSLQIITKVNLSVVSVSSLMFVLHRSKYIPWCKKKWNRVPSKSWMRNCRKITTYAYINRLAFFQSSRNCSINKFMCIIQVIHHSLKNSNHNIIIINKNNSQASKSETKIIYKAHTQTLPLSCLQSEVSSTYVSLSPCQCPKLFSNYYRYVSVSVSCFRYRCATLIAHLKTCDRLKALKLLRKIR